MKLIPIPVLLCILLATSLSGAELKPIFNGQNLDGWGAKHEACWTVEDGVLHAQSNPQQQGDELLTLKDDYRNFIVQVDFKMGEGRVDSGVFLRDTKEQIQIGDSGSLKRDMTALPYIPSLKGYPVQVETAHEVLDPKGWNTLKIKVVGSKYTTWLNGKEIMSYESSTIAPKGPIGFQLHPKRDMSISFRNILAVELPN